MSSKKNIRKVALSTMAASAAVVAVAPAASAAETPKFTDVKPGQDHYEAIISLASQGIISGFADGSFKPYNKVNRAQVATMLQRALKLPTPSNKAEALKGYKDVKATDEIADAVAAVSAAGVFAGSNGEFKPWASITREQMASVLVKAYGLDKFKADKVDIKLSNVDPAHKANVQVLANLGITTSTKEFNPSNAISRDQFSSFVDRTQKEVEKQNAEAAVQSVKAVSATQVEVKFNKAVAKASVVQDNGTLVSDVFDFKALDNNANGGLQTNDVTANTSTGELSKDGKTLTITATAGKVFEGRYDVTVDGALDTDGKAVAKYVGKNLDFGKDTTAPTVTQVEKVNASTVRVHFSEPLSEKGSWTYKDAEGKAVTVDNTFTAGSSVVTLTVNDANVAAGATITATVLGAKDQAGNLLNPNPTEVTFTKGAKDGVQPTVTSVTPKGLDKFEIKFSEEVQGLVAGNIYVDGSALTTDEIKQDENDKTKYEVTLLAAKTAGLHKIEVKETGDVTPAKVTDLSGEELKPFTQIIDFKADTVAPKFVSSAVVVDSTSKVEKLVLTFDKEVKEPAPFTATEATEFNKDLVTTKGTLTNGQLKVNTKNKKQLEVVLNTVKFTPATGSAQDLAKDATYTVKFAKGFVADTNTTANDAEAFEVKFKRGEDGAAASTDKAEVALVTANATDNSKIDVKFKAAVDGVTATNVANYSIPGLEIEKATLNPVDSTDANSQTVTLTLKKGTNKLSGVRNITIKNVKAKNAEAMETVTLPVTLKENVAPTVTKAVFSGTDTATGKVNEITLTFSEAVNSADLSVFEVLAGEGTTATKFATTNTAISDANTATINVTNGLSTEDIAKGITVKFADGKTEVVKDTVGNILDFNLIKASY